MRKPTSVGRPALNVDVRVVDPNGHNAGDGEAGEILCRSDFLMLGYWNMPEATGEALAGGWYHTGDLAVRDEEGFLHARAFLFHMAGGGLVAGSSNFTAAGLAAAPGLNLGHYEDAVVGKVESWYEAMWTGPCPSTWRRCSSA